MAITKKSPNNIHLSGPMHVVQQKDDATGLGTYQASEAITPGHLVELFLNGTELNVRKNSSATEQVDLLIALNQPECNLGIDDAYAAGDTVKMGRPQVGSVDYMLIASGQNISAGEGLQSAGDGTLATASATTATANLMLWKSLDNPGAVTVLTRIRAQRIQ